MIFPANLLTGAKHRAAFSTNHLTDILTQLNRTTTNTTTKKPNLNI